ncbi:MAG: glycosyltransferase, partial [Planctomycetaceae bacterium]|nr:glycosyltransferase [Planctomycetaceae bacterium]
MEGWNVLNRNISFWGSLAYCFTRESLIDLLHTPDVILHSGTTGTDTVLSNAIRACGRQFYSHIPSLCAHTGGGISTANHPDLEDSAPLGFSEVYRVSDGRRHSIFNVQGLKNVPTDVSILIKTFERPECLKRLLSSIRSMYPKIQIVIADDSRQPYAQSYRDDVTTVVLLPFDSGVSAGRNAALKLIDSRYFVVCDDDYEFDSRTDLWQLRQNIEDYGFDILGAEVMDSSRSGQFDRPTNFNLILNRDSNDTIRTKRLTSMSRVTKCDVVANFFIGRTDSVHDMLGGWDGELKIAEHLEFFIRAKEAN